MDAEGLPVERKSVHYDLVIDGKRYPPKYIVSIATLLATGHAYSAADFNAVEAKNYFRARGYEVIDRRLEAEKLVVVEDEESRFPEGGKRYRMHVQLERDTAISKKAKAKRLAETGMLKCEVCAFDFAQCYGSLGQGFIEAHHVVPVSKLDGVSKTKIADLALVCPNCHRMLHKDNPLPTVEALKALVHAKVT